MEYIRQTISSNKLIGIFNIPLALRDKEVDVIIVPAGNDVGEKSNYKCNLGYWDGPELPDVFFDPLPEEDLQAWGL